MSYCPECAKLEFENALLKQHVENFVKDANNQTREIVRLRGIIERAKERLDLHRLANGKLHSATEILNEAGKGEGNLRKGGGWYE